MSKIYLLGIFLFLYFSASGQERKLLTGKIVTQDQEFSFINIINLSSKTGTTNNKSGEFEISVAKNDTLLFSSVQYERREIVITREIFEKSFLIVLLMEKLDELKEVSISNINLTGNLLKDLEFIPTLTQADLGFPMSDQPKPTSIERKLKTASNVSTSSKYNSPGLVNVSLDGIINRINGKTEKLEKAAANEDLSQAVDAGVAALPVSFFSELGIPKDRLRDFVYFCAEDEFFLSLLPEAKRLELLEFYQLKAPKFVTERL